MPTIAHALLGGAIAMIFFSLTNSENWNADKRFSERMVILVAFNSFIGPDIFTMFYAFDLDPSQIIIKPFVHSILGWPLWCLGIMWIWYYVINIKSTEQTALSKKSTLLCLVAAGEIHFYLDLLDSPVTLIGFGNWTINISLQDHFLIGMKYQYGPLHDVFPWFNMTELFFIGIIFLIILVYSLFRFQTKYTYLISAIFVAFIMACYILIGSYVVGFENDLGVTLYFCGLLLLPMVLLMYAME